MAIEDTQSGFSQKILNYKSRVAELAIGLTSNKLIDIGFDYVLYPFVIYYFGVLKGGIVMTALSLLACILSIRFYDWLGRDWLGIEAIKNIKGYSGKKMLGRFTSWIMAKSDPFVFIFLSIHYDAFITTVYMRHGAFNGMRRRDWKIFYSSLLVSNVYWTLIAYTGVSIIQYLWSVI